MGKQQVQQHLLKANDQHVQYPRERLEAGQLVFSWPQRLCLPRQAHESEGRPSPCQTVRLSLCIPSPMQTGVMPALAVTLQPRRARLLFLHRGEHCLRTEGKLSLREDGAVGVIWKLVNFSWFVHFCQIKITLSLAAQTLPMINSAHWVGAFLCHHFPYHLCAPFLPHWQHLCARSGPIQGQQEPSKNHFSKEMPTQFTSNEKCIKYWHFLTKCSQSMHKHSTKLH